MIPASWQHGVAAVFSTIGVTWLKARGLVQEYPGCTLALWFLSFVAGVWL
jgi:hypothetical protein